METPIKIVLYILVFRKCFWLYRDGAAGAAGEDDIRGVELAGCCEHALVNWLFLHTV
jgi:hypothetical protein